MAKQKAKRTVKVKSAKESTADSSHKPKLVLETKRSEHPGKLDPVVMTVIANRLDGIVREMTNTLLRRHASSYS